MKRVLVVEDDDELRAVLIDVLSEEGRRVDAVRDGVEALALQNTKSYDVILCDLRLPRLDGPALYEALHAGRYTVPFPRLIFMTGYAADRTYAAFLKRTNAPTLQKPFNLKVVRQVVNVLLSGSHST